jgi:hypothetical protein
MKFGFKWFWFTQLFIGVGLIVAKDQFGITISNLFIGFATDEFWNMEDYS